MHSSEKLSNGHNYLLIKRKKPDSGGRRAFNNVKFTIKLPTDNESV